jgi:hypothetical protein
MVAGNPVHAGPGEASAAKDIATTDNDTELHAKGYHFFQFSSNTSQYSRINAVVPATHEYFTAELQQDAPVEQASIVHAIKNRAVYIEWLVKNPVDSTGFAALRG